MLRGIAPWFLAAAQMHLTTVIDYRLDLLIYGAASLLVTVLVDLWLRRRGSGALDRRLLLLVVAVILTGTLVAEKMGEREGRRVGAVLQGMARAYAAEMEALEHWRLPRTFGTQNPLYRQLISAEQRWLKNNPLVADVYTVRRDAGGRTFFVVDSDTDYNRDGKIDAEREARVPPGEPMTEYDRGLDLALSGVVNFSAEVVSDRWGVWVGSWAPLRNRSGKVEAALGVDFPADTWLNAILNQRVFALSWFGVLLSVLLGSAASHTLSRAEVRQRRLTQSVLRESEEEMATLADAAGNPILWIEVDGTVRRCNRAGERLLGHPRRELAGRRLQEFLSSERGLGEFERVLGEVTRFQGTLSTEAELAAGAETGRSYLWTLAAIPGDVGEASGVIVVGNDITSQLEMQEALRAARDAAEAANRSKSHFLANVSHEIRTPMTAILGYAETLGEPDLAPLERDRAIETIRRNGDHLLSLISDILDISRIEAGKMEVERIACSPIHLLRDTVDSCRVRADAKGLQIGLKFLTDVPAQIWTDPTRCRQILINLVANAVKFTEIGSVTLEASLVGGGIGKYLQVDVADTGVGIDPERAPSLFQAFSQLDASYARRYGGSGLGLVISRRLAEMLGGGVELVDSQPGVGSRFRMRVSVGDIQGVPHVEPAAAAAGTEVPRPAKTSTRALEGRVLLAEDGPDNQRLIAHFLRRAGAEVEVAGDGRLAVEQVMRAVEEGRPFDWVLMDMQMPVLDGYGATRELRDRGYRGCILALTAHAMEEDRLRCLRAGCDGYASKPIDRGKLSELLYQHRPEART